MFPNLKEAWIRFNSDSPKFFKKIIAVSLTLGGVGLAIITTPATVIVFPAVVLTIANQLVTVGAVAAIVAKFTVNDSSVLPKKEEDKK